LRDDRERMRSMILAWLLIALSSLVALIAGDVVAESADTGGQQIEAFGRVLFSPGLPAGAWILAGIGAAGTLLLVTAIANLRGRYLERRMAKEIDDRFEELSQREAGESARAHLLQTRAGELEHSLEILSRQRDDVSREIERGRERAAEIRRVAEQQRRALEELASLAEEHVVVVPDLPSEFLDEEDVTAADADRR
jgi:hypothetical protein